MMTGQKLRWTWIAAILCLLLGAKAAQGLALHPAVGGLPSDTASATSSVAIVRTAGDVESAVRRAVTQAGGLDGVISPGDIVVVKVNLVMDAPAGSGMVTDPAVARAVVRLAREAGAGQVIIAEGTAQYREGDANRDRFATRAAFRVAGYDGDGDMVDDATGAPLVDLNDSGGTDVADPSLMAQVTLPVGLIRTEYWLPRTVLDADVLISVPVLKNHYLAGFTLGMKNLIGLLPADLYHGPGNIYGKHSLAHGPIELDRHIVDLNLARRPDLVVVDGQRGMVDGPIGSQIIEPPMDLIMAGRDVVAVDTVGALIVGYDPRAIPYLELAGQHGLGQSDTRQIRVVGARVDQVRRNFPAPYADSPARRADAEPPAVAFTGPAGEAWQGLVTVRADASDNDDVARLELYLDGEQVGQAMPPGWAFELDTARYPTGAHTVQLVAFDLSLNRTAVERQVRFVAPTALPSPTPPPPTPTPPPPTPTQAPPTAAPTQPTSTPLAPTPTSSPPPPPHRSPTPTPPLATHTPLPTTTTPTLQAGASTTSPAASVARAGEEAAAAPASEGETAGTAPSQDQHALLIAVLAILMMLCLFVMIISLWVALQQRSR